MLKTYPTRRVIKLLDAFMKQFKEKMVSMYIRIYNIKELVDPLCRDGADTSIVCILPSYLTNTHVLSFSGHLAILF